MVKNRACYRHDVVFWGVAAQVVGIYLSIHPSYLLIFQSPYGNDSWRMRQSHHSPAFTTCPLCVLQATALSTTYCARGAEQISPGSRGAVEVCPPPVTSNCTTQRERARASALPMCVNVRVSHTALQSAACSQLSKCCKRQIPNGQRAAAAAVTIWLGHLAVGSWVASECNSSTVEPRRCICLAGRQCQPSQPSQLRRRQGLLVIVKASSPKRHPGVTSQRTSQRLHLV